MDTEASKFLFLFLLSIPIVCSSGVFHSPVKDIEKQQHQREEKTFHSSGGELKIKTVEHNSPTTTFPTTPVTNPVNNPVTVTVPPDPSSPSIVTVTPTPASTPVTVSPTTPTTNPTNPAAPVTNPVTTPSPTTNNPVTTSPTPTGGAVSPPVGTNAPAVPGQRWCVARSGVPEKSVQAALDYACGIGGADCSAIQQSASCYNPNTLQNHASYAFNSYYQKNPVPTSCDFGGTAVTTNVNPSSGSCIFATLSSSTSPTTPSPITTTPTPPQTPNTASSTGATPTGSGAPPTILNASNPTLGGAPTGFGDNPPTVNTSSISISSSLQPFIGCIIVVTSIITGGIVLDI